MYKYTCLNPISQNGLSKLSADFVQVDSIEEADAILVRSAKMHDIELPASVVSVSRAGAGTNNIPVDKYAKQGVVVFNTPGANANGVKELVLLGMLLASRDIIGGIDWIRAEADNPEMPGQVEKQKKKYAGNEIMGKKLGIIGLGAIGQLVANAAIDLGMDVYGFDPYLSIDAAWNLSKEVHHINRVEDIYKECDFITVHVPLMDATRGMIGADAFALMKDGIVILNMARDGIVDEDELLKAIEAGKVKKYVTDFVTSKIAGKPGVIATPHLGASTDESEENCAVMAAIDMQEFINNGNIRHSVNYPNVDAGVCESAGRLSVAHENIPGMINNFSKIIGEAGINIDNFVDKGRGSVAYSIIDINTPATQEVIDKLNNAEGVWKVRVVK